MALIYFPTREVTYAAKALQCGQSPLLPGFFAAERAAMQEFAASEGIALIDFSDAFRDYVLGLDVNASYQDLPYFRYDGHLNQTGNRLVADGLCRGLAGRSLASKPCRP